VRHVRNGLSRLSAQRTIAGATIALGHLCLSVSPATAHPHVFPLVELTALFDDAGRFGGVQETWSFDSEFSGPIKLAMDDDQDGTISNAELAKALGSHGVLAWVVTADYFTRLTVAGRTVAHNMPRDVTLTFVAGRMVIQFRLPLAEPAAVVLGAGIDVFDPEFYFDFEFANPNLDVNRQPANCNVGIRDRTNIDPVAVMLIRTLGLKADPAVIADPAAGYAVRVAIDCK
jgi:ABC-type uncharacterized transport system substrate-binding protein